MIFLHQAASATSHEQILQRVTSKILQQTTSTTGIKRILQRLASNFLQRIICARVRSSFTTSNEQRVSLQRETGEF